MAFSNRANPLVLTIMEDEVVSNAGRAWSCLVCPQLRRRFDTHPRTRSGAVLSRTKQHRHSAVSTDEDITYEVRSTSYRGTPRGALSRTWYFVVRLKELQLLPTAGRRCLLESRLQDIQAEKIGIDEAVRSTPYFVLHAAAERQTPAPNNTKQHQTHQPPGLMMAWIN